MISTKTIIRVLILYSVVALALTACKANSTIAAESSDSTVNKHSSLTEDINKIVVASTYQLWNDAVRTITVNEKGDTVKDVQRIIIKEAQSQSEHNESKHISVMTDTLINTKYKYIRYTIKEHNSWWDALKLRYFNTLLLVAIAVIITLLMLICKPLQRWVRQKVSCI